MDPRVWHKVAAVSGVAALGLGTYGAHFFKPKNPSYKEQWILVSGTKLLPVCFASFALTLGFYFVYIGWKVWHTASLYHLVHTAALLAAPVTKYPTVFGVLLTSGILGFSGTCYAVAYLEDRTYSRVAPFGGFAFIGAWASLLF